MKCKRCPIQLYILSINKDECENGMEENNNVDYYTDEVDKIPTTIKPNETKINNDDEFYTNINNYLNNNHGSSGGVFFEKIILKILCDKNLRDFFTLEENIIIPKELDLIEKNEQNKVLDEYDFSKDILFNYDYKSNFPGVDATVICNSYIAAIQITINKTHDIVPTVSVLLSVYIYIYI